MLSTKFLFLIMTTGGWLQKNTQRIKIASILENDSIIFMYGDSIWEMLLLRTFADLKKVVHDYCPISNIWLDII